MVKPLRPGTDPAISWISPNKPLEVVPGGNAGTLESHAVNKLPIAPIAVFLPSSMLPIVSPSAPLTWPNGADLSSRVDKTTYEIKDLLQLLGLNGLILRRGRSR